MIALRLLLAAAIAAGLVAVPAASAETCAVESASLTWGFKETFRSYMSGSIANGEWTVSDGATYETPSFGWADGTGTSTPAGTSVAFEGAIRFTGHGGILDTTVAKPRIEWLGDSGTLFLDVSGTTQEGDPVDQTDVPFAALVLPTTALDGNSIALVDVTATLTDEGAAAFGTYPSGEPLDPLTLDLTLEEGCELPAPSAPGWLPWVAASLGAVVLAALALVVVLVRRRPAS